MTKEQAQIKELNDELVKARNYSMLLREKLHKIIEELENALRTARDL